MFYIKFNGDEENFSTGVSHFSSSPPTLVILWLWFELKEYLGMIMMLWSLLNVEFSSFSGENEFFDVEPCFRLYPWVRSFFRGEGV